MQMAEKTRKHLHPHATKETTANKQTCAIETSGLCKTYPNGTKALNNITLTIGESEFIVILGPSGAGKSTLLRSMNRLIEPTCGKIMLMGKDVTHVGGHHLRHIRRRVGMIFQQFNLVRRLTVLENVMAGRLPHCTGFIRGGLSLLRIFTRREREIAFECLSKVHIENLAFQRADTLSGGQQQRVAIARTLAQEPELILADEPVASLDPASAEIVMQTLLDIHENQHIPVIVNLHQIDLGRRYGKRIIGMNSGAICFDGAPESLDNQMLQLIYGKELDSGLGRISRKKTEKDKIPDRPTANLLESSFVGME